MAEAAAAAEAAEAAARGALRAAEEALRLGEALREALAAGRLELARARYALGPARVCAASRAGTSSRLPRERARFRAVVRRTSRLRRDEFRTM